VTKATVGMICALMALLGTAGCGSGTAEGLARYAVGSAVPGGCARREPRIDANPWPATLHKLAPPGATAIRLCRYGTLLRLALQRARLVTNLSLVNRLVYDFAHRRAARLPGRTTSHRQRRAHGLCIRDKRQS